MSFDAFISYAHQDKVAAQGACAKLESEGIRCWIAPRDILPGADWGESIVTAISDSKVFVLVFSGHSNTSLQIRREVERAVNRGIPIIPMRLEDIIPSKSLEYFLSTPHWLDAFPPPLERHLERLAESVKTLLKISQDPSSAGVFGDHASTEIRRDGRDRAGIGVEFTPSKTSKSAELLSRRNILVTGTVIGGGAVLTLGVRALLTRGPDTAWLTIKGVTGFGDVQSARIRVTATINGNSYIYPTLPGVDWAEIGPDMAPQSFQIPVSETYTVEFSGELQTGLFLRSSAPEHVSRKTSGIKVYTLHMVDHRTKAESIAAEIRYAISLGSPR